MKVVSIIVPAKNEENYINNCLKSIKEMDVPADWDSEIIVIDNMSSDRTASIAKSFGVRVLPYESKKIGDIRAFGASRARGQVLAYVDADCSVRPSWVNAALAVLEDNSVGAVGGYLDLPHSASCIERGWAIPFTKNEREDVELVGASFIVRRDVYDLVKGFNKNLSTGEDSEISRNIIASGYRTKMIPSCNVVHYGYPATIRDFFDRQVWQVLGQISPRKLFSDMTIFASIVFSVSILSSIFLLIFESKFWLLFVVLSFLIPFVFAAKRVVDLGSFPNVRSWPAIYFVSILYFLGRSWAVILYFFGLDYRRRYK